MALTFVISDPAEQEIRRLRKESAKFRVQRNEARAEAQALQAELDSLRPVGVGSDG
jgi:hypothetical protein